MNRHHYSFYVHNCRLVFLFRQDPSEEGQSYKPAEFHWKLNQVGLTGSLPNEAAFLRGVHGSPLRGQVCAEHEQVHFLLGCILIEYFHIYLAFCWGALEQQS